MTTTITTYQGYREIGKVMNNSTAAQKVELARIFRDNNDLQGPRVEGMILWLEEQAEQQYLREANEIARRVMNKNAYRCATRILHRNMFEGNGGFDYE